ncbi:MAG: hypothetical protein NTW25_08090 [Candidatus Kapabacteria bacterium]|nr:hypothetical protein [Candidatus Kapabacteria bacterium]
MVKEFKESQRINQLWLRLLLGLFTVVITIAMYNGIMQAYLAKDINLVFALLGIAMLEFGIVALVVFTKLYTEIDEKGIKVQMKPFHLKPKFFTWDEIELISVRKYRPLAEFGGWGLRIGLNGTAYNIKGNMGLQIVFKNKKMLLIGTQLADELSQFLVSNGKI